MNRRVYTGIFAAVVFVAFGFLTGCSSSSNSTPPPPTIAITASGGTPQSVAAGSAFAGLSATVTSNGTPASGVSVTFTAPSSGASCAFPGGATETDTTDSSGVATSSACTANSTAGAFTVTATTTGASSAATFSLTNVAPVTAGNYVFYASGQDNGGGTGINYYAIAGALTIDSGGNITAGEEDYNDGFVITSPGEPTTPDTIAPGGTLVIDPTTGLGTLTITSSYTSVGVAGVQVFAVQFVNPNHALITEFDGAATSSGSLDLQSALVDNNWAFAMSGVNPNYDSVAFGGVFSVSGGVLTGTYDVNDGDFGVSTGNALNAAASTPDAFGRLVITGITNPGWGTPITVAAYGVGPEAVRLIDVDTASDPGYDAAVGSAYGQGAATFDNTSLTAGVFAEIGQWSFTFANVGEFATDSGGNITSGLADDNELDWGVQQFGSDITGSTYDLVSSGINGYGSMALTNNGDITNLGVYMVSPTVNINDPNNTATDLGGALIVDLSSFGVTMGGMGVITPQTDTTSTDFAGNYAAGFQNFNYFEVASLCGDCELDMVGPFTMVSDGALSTASIGADDSDPFGTITGLETTGDTFDSTPLPVAAGYFSMLQANSTPNPLNATIGGLSGFFDVDIFQASATTLYWINVDATDFSVFLGTLQAQSSVAKARAAHRPATRIQQQRRTSKTTFGPHR